MKKVAYVDSIGAYGMKGENNFRKRITLVFIAATIIPMLCVGMLFQNQLTTILYDEHEKQIEANLMKVEQGVDLIIERYDYVLDAISSDRTIMSYYQSIYNEEVGFEEITERYKVLMAQAANRYPYIVGMAWFLEKRDTIYYNQLAAEVTSDSWILDEMDESYRVKKVIDEEGEENFLLQLQAKVRDSENPQSELGYIVMSIDMAVIDEALESHEDVISYLVCDDSIINSSNDTARGMNIEDVPNDNMQIGMDEIEYGDLVVYSYHSNLALLSAQRDQFVMWSAIVLIAESVLIFALYRAMRPMMNWLETLRKVIKEVGSGNLEVYMPEDIDTTKETKFISHEFNEAIQTMKVLLDKVKEVTVEQKNAELSALEAQIDPHFLYNTLDVINWKAIEVEEYEISEMLGALADILRYSVKNAGDEVSVSQEVSWLRQYITILEAKAGKNLAVSIDVLEEVEGYRIHKLLLQPFIENAIKHGYISKEEFKIEVVIDKLGKYLHVLIKDNGVGLTQEQVDQLNKCEELESKHLGINNVRKRLQLYYGDDATVFYESLKHAYTKVHLFIPLVISSRVGEKKE